MNKPTDLFHASPGESTDSLIDALLSEHARLGNHDDVGLLATVRARTTAIPGPLPLPEPRTRSFSRADRWKAAAMVAGILAVVGLVISRIETSGPRTDTLRLSMRPVTFTIGIDRVDSGEVDAWHTRPPRTAVAAPSSLSRVDFPSETAESLGLAYFGNNQLAGVPAAHYEFNQFDSLMLPSTELLAQVSIAADRTIREEGRRTVVFEGRVQLAHPDFRLTADRLEFSKAAEGVENQFGAFVATGRAVRVQKRTPSGALQVAEGLRASYQADGGALILSGGPPRLRTGDSQVTPDSLDAAIVLRQDGYQVIESAVLDGVFRQ